MAVPLLVLSGVAVAAVHQPSVKHWLHGSITRVFGFLGHELVAIDVVSSPSRVSLFVDGEAVGRLPIEIAKDDKFHSLMAAAPGYVPTSIPFKPDRPQRIIVTLQPAK